LLCFSFLRAKAATDLARLSHHYYICMSVCLSHMWISQKRCKLGSPNFYRRLSERLVSGTVKLFHKFEGGSPQTKALKITFRSLQLSSL